MEIQFKTRFRKEFRKADHNIQAAFERRLELFKEEPSHPQLKNHNLRGKYKGYRSINITGDWRALYTESKKVIWFEGLGTHSNLYK